jgi:two-component system capsular synthesis sensor histidine kinase RcsC
MESPVSDARVRILLADDEEAPLLVVREYLRCCGWEVDAVRTLDEARSLLETRGYSAVITDLRFTGPASAEGLTIAHIARERNPRSPVVVMTGYYNPEVEAQARRIGVDAFVPKPVPLWELARLVQGWAVAH